MMMFINQLIQAGLVLALSYLTFAQAEASTHAHNRHHASFFARRGTSASQSMSHLEDVMSLRRALTAAQSMVEKRDNVEIPELKLHELIDEVKAIEDQISNLLPAENNDSTSETTASQTQELVEPMPNTSVSDQALPTLEADGNAESQTSPGLGIFMEMPQEPEADLQTTTLTSTRQVTSTVTAYRTQSAISVANNPASTDISTVTNETESVGEEAEVPEDTFEVSDDEIETEVPEKFLGGSDSEGEEIEDNMDASKIGAELTNNAVDTMPEPASQPIAVEATTPAALESVGNTATSTTPQSSTSVEPATSPEPSSGSQLPSNPVSTPGQESATIQPSSSVVATFAPTSLSSGFQTVTLAGSKHR
jgi:hypothetical protein